MKNTGNIMNIKSLLIAGVLGTAMAAQASVIYQDHFSSDTSGDYIGTSTFGTATATFNVSGGTLNSPATGGGGETYDVFHDTALFGIGATLSVDITGLDDAYLSVSTTTRAANTPGEDGVRFNWQGNGTFRARRYTNGSSSDTNFDSSFDVNGPASLTLYLTRETDNTFSAAFDSGSGLTQLNTTGGAEKQIFTAGDTGNGNLFFGVETFDSGVRNFDNLQINNTVVPEPSTLALLGVGGAMLMAVRRRQNLK